ncbi:hypothetical protein AJ78_02317 [Emergomyces pasteurianus Ep9510]|uniref:C2H2-type domain-containing protein n=1 Tax=Emergomyces pasteurianus Ep9510 TaxID=1447872 RepID=A0A1J9PP06_9EURO|nr:hypothetical protein AJ78_02317 [Emergomyces pasteurianus Ep9510]
MARCAPCNRQFKTKRALEQHIQNSSSHTSMHDSNPHNRSFASKPALEKHIQNSSAHTSPHARRWSMYPTHHESVSHLLEEDGVYFKFHDVDDSTGCVNSYDTNIMGRFTCHNNSCTSTGWSSKRIAITIRMYPGAKYNARIYHQRCKSCKGLSQPLLDESYADRVAYRIKKWRVTYVRDAEMAIAAQSSVGESSQQGD